MVQFAKLSRKKVIFEDFLIFSPAVGHPGSTKILEDFFKKSQVRNSHYLFFFEICLVFLSCIKFFFCLIVRFEDENGGEKNFT